MQAVSHPPGWKREPSSPHPTYNYILASNFPFTLYAAWSGIRSYPRLKYVTTQGKKRSVSQFIHVRHATLSCSWN
jgi:hypothetical protein